MFLPKLIRKAAGLREGSSGKDTTALRKFETLTLPGKVTLRKEGN